MSAATRTEESMTAFTVAHYCVLPISSVKKLGSELRVFACALAEAKRLPRVEPPDAGVPRAGILAQTCLAIPRVRPIPREPSPERLES